MARQHIIPWNKVRAVPAILHTVEVNWISRSEIDTAYTGKLLKTYRRTVFKVNPVATTIMCALSPFQKFYKVSLVKMIMSVFIAYTARCTIILKISQLTF
jgi:hypothetical protein